MSTATLTLIQYGQWDGGTGWLNSAFNIVQIGDPFSVWVQVEAGAGTTDVPTALTVRFDPLFAEAGNLTVLAHQAVSPLTADFSASNLPRGVTSSPAVPITFAGGVPLDVTVPLSDGSGWGTLAMASLRQQWKADSLGRFRFAVGFYFDGVGGNFGYLSTTLTYSGAFTGVNGLETAAGTDQAAECSRCSLPILRNALVADGVTKQLVCPECYDPPTELVRRVWPFRG